MDLMLLEFHVMITSQVHQHQLSKLQEKIGSAETREGIFCCRGAIFACEFVMNFTSSEIHAANP
jgi:hypothetical protein